MSDLENIDGELLSAYLDGELSPDERTRVEARLAADPAAQQLYGELRFASFAVQSLPPETIGHDLRESVLRRAEEVMLASRGAANGVQAADPPAKEPVRLSDPVPQFTIGRTRRGWIWATVAMAAGIMIMFLQPGDEQDSSMPPVAVKDGSAIDQVAAADKAGIPELRQRSDPAAPLAAPAETMVAEAAAEAPLLTHGEGGELLAAAKPQQALSSDELGDESTGASEARLAATAPPAHQDKYLIVHVFVQPDALENKLFDRMLDKLGITIEESIEEPLASRDANTATSRTLGGRAGADRELDRYKKQPQEADVVLVKAPATTINSVLTKIQSDADDFAGILVDDVSASTPSTPLSSTTATKGPKKSVSSHLLSKFDRGQAPSPQDIERARHSDRYYFRSDSSRSGAGGGGYGGTLVDDEASPHESTLSFGSSGEVRRGRALRLKTERAEKEDREQAAAVADSSAPSDKLQLIPGLQVVKTPTSEANDNLHVLFVLSPADSKSAPSLPADNRAE